STAASVSTDKNGWRPTTSSTTRSSVDTKGTAPSGVFERRIPAIADLALAQPTDASLVEPPDAGFRPPDLGDLRTQPRDSGTARRSSSHGIDKLSGVAPRRLADRRVVRECLIGRRSRRGCEVDHLAPLFETFAHYLPVAPS